MRTATAILTILTSLASALPAQAQTLGQPIGMPMGTATAGPASPGNQDRATVRPDSRSSEMWRHGERAVATWQAPDLPTLRADEAMIRESGTRLVGQLEFDPIDHAKQLVQEAQIMESGLGTEQNLPRAFQLYCESARLGYGPALIQLGWLYAEGRGVPESRDAAGSLFARAARFGSDEGMELARTHGGTRDLLPSCLRDTVVEKGTAERPPTSSELAALFAKAGVASTIGQSAAMSSTRQEIVQIVLAEAPRFRLDPRLVLAVMATESAFNPNAVSNKNAVGLMQLIPETSERFGVTNPVDPRDNIRGGMAYLRWLLSYFRGDVSLTLAGYNAGEGAVNKYNGIPPFPETIAYVQRIRAAYPLDYHPYDPTASTARSAVPSKAAESVAIDQSR